MAMVYSNELLLEISGPGYHSSFFGPPAEAAVFNFVILDWEGQVVRFHQCANVTRSSFGTRNNCVPRNRR